MQSIAAGCGVIPSEARNLSSLLASSVKQPQTLVAARLNDLVIITELESVRVQDLHRASNFISH